jgi:tetratricopeptide (TPR) repeat protein
VFQMNLKRFGPVILVTILLLLPTLLIWLVSSQSFGGAFIISYGAILVITVLFIIKRDIRGYLQREPPGPIDEISKVLALGSMVPDRASRALIVSAHFLLWPPLAVHRVVHGNDYSLIRDTFDVPVLRMQFPSEAVVAVFGAVMAVAVLIIAPPQVTWPYKVFFVGCLVQVTARHLGYLLSPDFLRESFRQRPGDVFLRLLAVAIADLTTLAVVYTGLNLASPPGLSLKGVLNTALNLLTLKPSLEALVQSRSTFWQRSQILSAIIYYASIVRVLWPPRELKRKNSDVVRIAKDFALQGRYTDALRHLKSVVNPDNDVNKAFGLCHLALGDLDQALSYTQRNARGGQRKDYALFLLFNSIPFVETPREELASYGDMERSFPRSRTQKRIHKELFEYAAEAEVADAVLWLAYLNYSLLEPLPAIEREPEIKEMLERPEFPLTRYFAAFEIGEMQVTFCRRMKEGVGTNVPDPEGFESAVQRNLLDLVDALLAEKPQSLPDLALKTGTLLGVASLIEGQPTEELGETIDAGVEEIRRQIRDTDNDNGRAIACQVLSTLAAFMPTSVDPSNRFFQLTQQSVEFLEIEGAWIVHAILPEQLSQRRPSW